MRLRRAGHQRHCASVSLGHEQTAIGHRQSKLTGSGHGDPYRSRGYPCAKDVARLAETAALKVRDQLQEQPFIATKFCAMHAADVETAARRRCNRAEQTLERRQA